MSDESINLVSDSDAVEMDVADEHNHTHTAGAVHGNSGDAYRSLDHNHDDDNHDHDHDHHLDTATATATSSQAPQLTPQQRAMLMMQQRMQAQAQAQAQAAAASSSSSDHDAGTGLGMDDSKQLQAVNMMPQDEFARLSPAEIETQFLALPTRMRADIEQQLSIMPEQMRHQMRLNMIRQAAIWKQKPDEALLFAVKKHNVPLVKMLIEEFGANPNAVDAEGNNGLHWATWYKNPAITEYLIERRCSVHHANPKLQLPIHWACMGGDLQCIRALVNAGANLTAQDKDGYYPVHCCAQHGNTTALDYLKLVGADIYALDYNNRTPLHWAAFKNELITTTWLVQQGLELSAKDNGGRTPLHWAASQNNIEIVSYLLGEMETTGEMNLLTLKDDTDLTPLELAEKKESRAVAKYLKDVEKRENSQFWRIWQIMFCMTNKKTNRTLQSGRNISIWLALITSWSAFDHALWVYSNTPSVNKATHWAVFIGIALMTALWLKTHLTDPGFLPKSGGGITNRDQPLNTVIAVRSDDDEKSGMLAADSLDDGASIANLTYEQLLEKGLADAICVSCRITRPLRAKHCRHCDRCVSRFDHHCPWVNTCVGGNNHFWFVWFLITVVWCISLYFAVHVKYLQEPENKDDVWRYVVEIPVLAHHLFMIIYVLLLLSQQCTMIFNNLTTNEKINSYRYAYLRSSTGEFHNPFDQGTLGNCLSFCWLKPEKKVAPLTQYYSQVHVAEGGHGGHGHSHGGGGGGGGHGHSHGGGGGGGGHGHSHGGRGGGHGHAH